MYYYVPHTGRFEQRARSVAPRSTYSTYSLPRRSMARDDDVLYIPLNRHLPSSYGYDTSGNENYTRSQVNRNLIMSSAAMEDNFDVSNRSRQRDREIMAAANRAIAATEQYSSPRAAVAARRAMRGQSTPPGPVQTSANISRTEYVRTQAKPIQDVDGPKKPNLMSWQYRIDAYTPPEDLVFVPRKLSSVKASLLDCKNKLDRHRQLMDRYLVTDTGMSVDDMRGNETHTL